MHKILRKTYNSVTTDTNFVGFIWRALNAEMIETTILTIVWGFLIGILVSAPMGPTGILVIQRTLNKGKLPGLLTGLGASLSDFIYALISVFALGLVVDWLEQYKSTLQFAGSFFIALYAVYLWKSNPAAGLGTKDTTTDLMSPRMRASGILKNFFSGFGITISNPLIIFFYIALFARTNFLFAASDENWWLYFIGFGTLVGGAVCWWLLITWIINKVRNNFSLRTLRNINRVIAGIMLAIALVGCGNGIYYLIAS